MPAYLTEADLTTDVTRLVDEKFGPFKTTIEIDKVLGNLVASRDVHEVLDEPGPLEVLTALASSGEEAAIIKAKVADLNEKFVGLRMIFYAASSTEQAGAIEALAEAALLNERDRARLDTLVGLYSQILSMADGQIAQPDDSAEAMLASVTPEIVSKYIGQLYDSMTWLRPEEVLFSADKLNALAESREPNALLVQTWIQFIFDENHYAAVVERFEKMQQPFLADVGRILLYQARVMRGGTATPQIILRDGDDISATLDRLEKYDREEFDTIKNLESMITLFSGGLRFLLGSQVQLPVETRINHLARAEAAFDRSEIPLFRTWAPMICWNRAQLLQGNERAEAEMAALVRVNTLYAESAVEKEPVARLSAMVMLTVLPAQWKLAKGDFAGAIESATIGKSLAQMLYKLMREELAPLDEELAKAAADSSLDALELQQLLNLRNSLVGIVENSRATEFAMDLSILMGKAKMEEERNNFAEAHSLYHQAAELERKTIGSLRALLLSFLDSQAVDSRLLSQGFQHEARAEYFQALADLNRGDQRLMEGDYGTATENYEKAKTAFSAAADFWNREVERLSESPPEQRTKAMQEQANSTDRVRYADARVEMAKGERAANLTRGWEAAKHFEKAAGIFAELVELAQSAQSSRTQAIFKASQDVCTARYLMESLQKSQQPFNVEFSNEIMDLLDSAARLFAENSEGRWGGYTRALRFQYEGMINWQLARSGARNGDASLARTAQDRIAVAVSLLREIGLESRARELESRGRNAADRASFALPAIVLPKPNETSNLSQGPALNIIPQFPASGAQRDSSPTRETDLRKLVARSIALDRRMADVRQRLERGRLDDGQYADLSGDLDRERIETLLELQRVLGGRNGEIDSILRSTIQTEPTPELLDRLAQVAVAKNLPQSVVEEIRRGQGSLVSWVVELSLDPMTSANA